MGKTEVVNALEDAASSTAGTEKLLKFLEMKKSFNFHCSQDGLLPDVVTWLQETEGPLHKTMKIVEDAVQWLRSVPGEDFIVKGKT